MRRIVVQYQGTAHEAEELEWDSREPEKWTVLEVADGTVVKFKAVIVKVARLLNQRNEFGEPVYVVFSNNVVTSHVSAALMVQEPR